MALAVDFEPVAGDLELVEFGDAVELVLEVAAAQVLGFAAVDAEEVVMVAGMVGGVELVVEVAVFEEDAAEGAGLDEEFEGAVDGGAADAGEFVAEFLGGEVAVFAGDGGDDLTAGAGIAVALFTQGVEEVFGQGIVAVAHGLILLVPVSSGY